MTNELDAALDFLPVDDSTRGPQLLGFTGTVLSVEPELDEKYGGTRIRLVFEDLADIQAAPGQVFEFPVFDIAVRLPKVGPRGTASKTNAYAVLTTSAKKVIPDLASFRELKGKKLKMGYTPEHTLYNKEKGEYQGSAWEVVAVVGSNGAAPAVGNRNARELALALIDGKTALKWRTAALSDAAIRSELTTVIMNNKLLQEWEAAGIVVKADDGMYSVVK